MTHAHFIPLWASLRFVIYCINNFLFLFAFSLYDRKKSLTV